MCLANDSPHGSASISTLPLIDQSAQFSFWLGNAHLSSEASTAHKLRRNGVERRAAAAAAAGRGWTSVGRHSVGWEAGAGGVSVTGSICGE